MKKSCCSALLALLLLFVPLSARAADPSPKDAVISLMEEIRGWDADAAASMLDETVPGGYGETFGSIALLPLLAKLDYTLGNEKITGRSAQVDLAVTAADIKGFAGDIAAEAVGFAALKKLTGLPLDVDSYVAGRVSSALAADSLTTIKTDTTVYLLQGGDGVWKLDMTDLRNLDFLKALTGGFVEFEEPLRALFSIEEVPGR